jgi:hypothetical protein
MTPAGPARRARRWDGSWSMRPGGGGRTAQRAFCVAAGPEARHHRSVPRPPDPPGHALPVRHRGVAGRARCEPAACHSDITPGCTDVRLTRGPRGSPPPGRVLLAGALRLAAARHPRRHLQQKPYPPHLAGDPPCRG